MSAMEAGPAVVVADVQVRVIFDQRTPVPLQEFLVPHGEVQIP
jgi:hypothetical protein